MDTFAVIIIVGIAVLCSVRLLARTFSHPEKCCGCAHARQCAVKPDASPQKKHSKEKDVSCAP